MSAERVEGLPEVTPIVGDYSLVGHATDLVAAEVHDIAEQQYPPSSVGTTPSTVEREQPGVPVVEQTPPESSPLAKTGLDATTLGTIALAMFGAGAVLVAASRRPGRRY